MYPHLGCETCLPLGELINQGEKDYGWVSGPAQKKKKKKHPQGNGMMLKNYSDGDSGNIDLRLAAYQLTGEQQFCHNNSHESN